MWEWILSGDIQYGHYNEDGTISVEAVKKHEVVSDDRISTPMPLEWDLTTELKTIVNNARVEIAKSIADLDLVVRCHDKFGKGLIKKLKVSPDAFIQAALQLAYYRTRGEFCFTCKFIPPL